jgi:carboxypeptidase Q
MKEPAYRSIVNGSSWAITVVPETDPLMARPFMRPARLTTRIVVLLMALSTVGVMSQEAVDLGVIDRIKNEAFARSEVMDHLRNLADVHGPRLTGSPQFEEAAKWAAERLTSYGLSNVHIERWGPFGRRWSVEQYSVEQVAPHYVRLSAMPLAWSASTPGPISGEPIVTPLDTSFEHGGFKKMSANFAAYCK